MSHTPGPWGLKLARYRDDAPVFGYAITAEGRVPYVASAGVAEPNHALIVGSEFRKLVTTGFTEPEVEANGRLIAAAPDLLAFVKKCANDRDDCISPGWREQARALIVKVQAQPQGGEGE